MSAARPTSRVIVPLLLSLGAGCAHVGAAPSVARDPLVPTVPPLEGPCEPRYELAAQGAPVLLCDASEEVTTSWPCARAGARTVCLELDEAGPILGWVHGAVSPEGAIVGLLDSQIEGPYASLFLVVSDDGGATWRERAVIPKPSWLALFHRLELGATWTLEVELDASADDPALAGIHRATSRDEGRTWSPWTRVVAVAPSEP